LPDISLDVPNANAILDKVLIAGARKGFINEDIMEMAPNKYVLSQTIHIDSNSIVKICIYLMCKEVEKDLCPRAMVVALKTKTDIKTIERQIFCWVSKNKK
jgi:hypothetical protein